MNVGCYLPPTFSEFCAVLRINPVPADFEPNYAGFQVAERRGEWVVDDVVKLVIDITLVEVGHVQALVSKSLNIEEILKKSDNIYTFKKSFWFLKSLTEEKIQTDSSAKFDWNKIKSYFRSFNRARKAGEDLENKRSRLLSLMNLLETKYKAESERKILSPHRNILLKRKELARNIFPHNIVDVYNRAQASSKTLRTIDKGVRVQIGLGVDSTFIPKKINRESVVLDDKTTPSKKVDKSMLYVAGWSLNGEEL
ncbi:hypothetical protein C4J99_1509 [Pseudomonas synxantha]|nr:hypothetical protein C4J99_1509 [Pseudomonas synxantha]